MYNSKYLKVDNPSKKNLKNPSPQVSVPFESQEGFMNGLPPEGHHYRILGDTLFNPTPFPIKAVANTGEMKYLAPFDTTNVNFDGADYVDEYLDDDQIAELKKGGYVVEECLECGGSVRKYQDTGEVQYDDPTTGMSPLHRVAAYTTNPAYLNYIQEVPLPKHQENVRRGNQALDLLLQLEEEYPGEATKGWSNLDVKNFEDIGCDPSNMACIATAAKAFSAVDKPNFGDLDWDQISNYRLERSRKQGTLEEQWPGFKLGYTGTGPEAREAAYRYAEDTPYTSVISATGPKTNDHAVIHGHSPSGESWVSHSPGYEAALQSGPASGWSSWHGGDHEKDYEVDPSTRFNVISYQPERVSQQEVSEWAPKVRGWFTPPAELNPRAAELIPSMADYIPEMEPSGVMKQGGIKLDPAKKGTFKALATRKGMTLDELSRDIKNNPDEYSTAAKRKRAFYEGIVKNQEGGYVDMELDEDDINFLNFIGVRTEDI